MKSSQTLTKLSISNHASSISISNNIIVIEDHVLSKCFNLKRIDVESTNTQFASIDGILFTKPSETLLRFPIQHDLSNYPIPTSVTSIGDFAFSKCYNLQSISIPSSVTSIGDFAFSCCSQLLSIEIPSSVTSIGNSAFSNCSSLESITVDHQNLQYTSNDGILFTKNCETLLCFPAKHHLTNYTIPTSVTSIGNSAFSSCSNLQSITIPSSVTSIGDSAFSSCTQLPSITIPKSVTTIKCDIFSGCQNLHSIVIPPHFFQDEMKSYYLTSCPHHHI